MNYDELRCTKIQSDVLIIKEWAISLIIMIFDVIKLLSYMHHSNIPTQKDLKTERRKDRKTVRAGVGEQ